MEDLYIHIHCARQNGVSPVMAQLSIAEEVTANNENSEANGGVEPAAENSIGRVHEFDINSLKFADENKEKVYRKVKAMTADEANADLDESTLFLTALGGPSHGCIKGFGSMLQPKKIATTRERQSHATSSISGLTNSAVQETFSRAEVDVMVPECDFRIAEERAERKRDQEQNELMFSALFRMHELQKPPLVNGPTAQPLEEGPSQLQMEFNSDVAVALQPNQGGSYQALLSSQSAQEIARNDADLTNWWGDQPSI